MRSSLLSGVRVLDLTTPLAWDCGRFLASLGAEVLRVDLPDAPVDRDWRAGQADKTCLSLDYRKAEGKAALRRLAGEADIVVESFAPGALAAMGLSIAELAAANPKLVLVSITPFGQTGPYASYKAGELVVSAMSGVMNVNGHPDRWPLKEAGNALFFHAAIAGAMGGVFAHYGTRHGLPGQQVDISAQELAAGRNTVGNMAWQFDRIVAHRIGTFTDTSRGPEPAIWQTRDGYAVTPLLLPGRPAAEATAKWMEELGYGNPLAGFDPASRRPDAALMARWWEAIGVFLADRTRADLVGEGVRRGAGIYPINLPRDVIEDAHLDARGFFARAEGLAEAPLLFPQWFCRTGDMAGGAVRIPLAPERKAGWRPRPAPVASPMAQSPRRLPLEGIKLLDFSWAIVGNTAAKMLGDLGAEVVKVESATRMSIERAHIPVKNVTREGAPDNNPWFANLATSKRSLALALGNPESRPVLDRLTEWADIVFENFSPGVMARLGLGWEALSARRPDLIIASGSIFGQTGPLSHLPGSETTGSGWSGRTGMTGDPDRSPLIPSCTYGDSVTPFILCTAMIGAVIRRDRTGEGCRIDASMVDILVQQMLPEMLASQRLALAGGDGSLPRQGNHASEWAPHNVYPASGDDRWIAISIFDDAQFTALARIMGCPDLASDVRFATAAARKVNEADLDALVANFTRKLDPWQGAERLQAAGIAAGPVQGADAIVDRDPQLRHRGFLQNVPHALLGPFPHQRTPVTLSATPPRMIPAPKLGEHSRQICIETLGMSEAEFERLRGKGVFC